MAGLILTEELVDAAVLGGCVLGGGGGGSMAEGRKMANLAVNLTSLKLIDIEDLEESSVLINVAAVGAPSAKEAYAEPMHYLQAVELMKKVIDIKIDGIITNEVGGLATINGWLQAAMLGLPIVDAPCNGRAHPTGIMGAMGLHKNKDYTSVQAAVGGSEDRHTFTKILAIGSVERASAVVRAAAVQAGGLVSVARNPVTCKYVKDNAALGSVKQAITLGQKMIKAKEKNSKEVLYAACDFLKGEIVSVGTVEKLQLITKDGFDLGIVTIGEDCEITFWNEYMTLEKSGQRLATFPDLIMTMDANTGLPVPSAEIKRGQRIAVLRVERGNIILGAGMKDPELLKACEEATGKKMLDYIF